MAEAEDTARLPGFMPNRLPENAPRPDFDPKSTAKTRQPRRCSATPIFAARVVLRTASPFDVNLEIIEPMKGCGTAMFLLHRTAIKAT